MPLADDDSRRDHDQNGEQAHREAQEAADVAERGRREAEVALARARDESAASAEAVQVANGTPFGLEGYVFAGDPERGMAVARQIRAGGTQWRPHQAPRAGNARPVTSCATHR